MHIEHEIKTNQHSIYLFLQADKTNASAFTASEMSCNVAGNSKVGLCVEQKTSKSTPSTMKKELVRKGVHKVRLHSNIKRNNYNN